LQLLSIMYKPIFIRRRITLIRGHRHLATHQSYDNKIRRTDGHAISSLFEMVYPTATHNDIEVNYNYATIHMYFSPISLKQAYLHDRHSDISSEYEAR
jgi:hypothetical protein